jgi:hypothetical protein
MDQTKAWYESSAVWGSILAAISPVAATILHISMTGDTQLQLANVLALLGGAVGGSIGIIGRIKAQSKIG